MPKVFAVVPAAGQGTRIGDAVPKQYLPVAGKPLMFHSVEALAAVARVERIFVCLSPLDRHWGAHDWSALHDKVQAVFCGGAYRAETVLNALKHLEASIGKDDWVLVHELEDDQVGGLLAIPLADTLKSGDENQRVAATIPRLNLWRAQTPQMFKYSLLRRGLENKPTATDEAEAVESIGYNAPRLVQGDDSNIKVTFAEDLKIAEMILDEQGRIRL